MVEYFIDSSALFAWADRSSDEGQAVEALICEGRVGLVTTNIVFAETISFITKRAGKSKGILFGEQCLSSNILHLAYIDAKMQQEGWALYKKYRDKDFDLVDATSFVYCRSHGIRRVLTLDRHFAQMGFQVLP